MEHSVSLINKIKDQFSYYLKHCAKDSKRKSLCELIKESSNKCHTSKNNKLIDLSSMPSSSLIMYKYDSADKLKTNKIELKKGNILIGLIRPNLKKCLVSPIDGITTGTIGQFEITQKAFKSFVLGIITSDTFWTYLVHQSTGTKMPVIKSKDILNFQFTWDENAYQLSKFNNSYYDLIINLNNNNSTLNDLKNDLLRYLIN